MPPAQLSPDNNGGYNIFAAKACQCLRALGSVMVLIVLSVIGLTYYTTVFCVYGPLMLRHGNKSEIAAVVVILYNLLVRVPGGGGGRERRRRHGASRERWGGASRAPGWFVLPQDRALLRLRHPLRLSLTAQVFMLLWSYFAAVLTEPGRVPPGWQPSDDVEEVRRRPLSAATPARRQGALSVLLCSPPHALCACPWLTRLGRTRRRGVGTRSRGGGSAASAAPGNRTAHTTAPSAGAAS